MTDAQADRLIATIERLTAAIASAVIGGAAEKSKRDYSDRDKGPVLVATGLVKEIKSTTIKKGKRTGDTMWFVTLDTGFRTSLFAEKNMLMCRDAQDTDRQVSIEYRENGQYKDLVSMGFAPGGAGAAPATEEEDDTPF